MEAGKRKSLTKGATNLLPEATTFDSLGATSLAKESESHGPAVGATRIARFWGTWLAL
jgi:hypothetical protein